MACPNGNAGPRWPVEYAVEATLLLPTMELEGSEGAGSAVEFEIRMRRVES
jgi:hypothetical protein